MSKPLSLDLRKRAVGAVLDEGMSRHQAAARFGVGVSTVINWVRRFRETGGVGARQIGGYKAKVIFWGYEEFFLGRVRKGGFPLRGLGAELAQCGLKDQYKYE